MSLEDFVFNIIRKETEQLFATGGRHSNMQVFPIERQLEEALHLILSYTFGKYKLDIQNAFMDETTTSIKITQKELLDMGFVPVGVKRNIDALDKILQNNKELAYINLYIVEYEETETQLGRWELAVMVTAEEECLLELGVLT